MTERVELYASSVRTNGGTLESFVGLIDSTNINIMHSGCENTMQRCVYGRHKRVLCLTYQTVTTQNGLIFHLFGPIEERNLMRTCTEILDLRMRFNCNS